MQPVQNFEWLGKIPEQPPYMKKYPFHPFGSAGPGFSVQNPIGPALSVQTPMERDVVKKPSIPDYLLDIYKLMSEIHPAVSMHHNTFGATVHFDKAMICVQEDRISGFVSAEARGKYVGPDDDFIKWNDTPNGPCFWVSVLNREDAVRAEKEINMLLRLHFACV